MRKGKAGSKSGMTIVEVMVALLIVLLTMTFFAGQITSSVRILNQSVANVKNEEEFESEFYKVREDGGEDLVQGIHLNWVKDGQVQSRIYVPGISLKAAGNEEKVRYYFESR